jgi:hypothetical protein
MRDEDDLIGFEAIERAPDEGLMTVWNVKLEDGVGSCRVPLAEVFSGGHDETDHVLNARYAIANHINDRGVSDAALLEGYVIESLR